jgi:hypothetical protein
MTDIPVYSYEDLRERADEFLRKYHPSANIPVPNSLFTGNDQLKTNTVLQMRDAGVDFKTI